MQRTLFKYAGLTTLLIFQNGCATRALWEADFRTFHEPALAANLKLFQGNQETEVLVVYNEANEKSDRVRERAFWIDTSKTQPPAPFRPRFVSPRESKGLAPILVLQADPPANGLAAVVSTNQTSFTICSNGAPALRCELPIYAGKSGQIEQISLTPLAAAADLTIVGGYLFLYAWPKTATY